MQETPYGFRVVGDCREPRRLVNPAAAFAGYAACDERAEIHHEAYLSAFWFGADFRRLLEMANSPKGYNGVCWSPWLWWDIDREGDLERATSDARRLCAALVERYRIDGDDLLIFFSGAKGYHIGLPTSLWQPAPNVMFHRQARRFAERFAASLGMAIDGGVYDKVRLFRAPNSRHPKTGLHKRRLGFEELLHLRTQAIARFAAEPAPFDLPTPPTINPQTAADWQAAGADLDRQAEAAQQRRLANGGAATLNRATLEFIRDGAPNRERAKRLYTAAANLAEFGCPSALAHALLTEAALDSGLPPSEVRRQIDCGLNRQP